MSRTLSADTVAAMMRTQSSGPVLWALDIDHEDFAEPVRVVNNGEDVSIGGELYTAAGFEVGMPEESEDGFRSAKLMINNVDQWMTAALRGMSGTFTFTLSLVTASDLGASPPEFDNVEVTFMPFTLTGIEYTRESVRATLDYERVSDRAFPVDTFTPYDFPGLF